MGNHHTQIFIFVIIDYIKFRRTTNWSKCVVRPLCIPAEAYNKIWHRLQQQQHSYYMLNHSQILFIIIHSSTIRKFYSRETRDIQCKYWVTHILSYHIHHFFALSSLFNILLSLFLSLSFFSCILYLQFNFLLFF